MATRYTSTINVRCWKQHACVACGAKFSYLFRRKVTGSAGSPEGATRAAQKNVGKTLARNVNNQPCPGCGIYQPDMIGQGRAKRQTLLFILSVVAAVVLLVLSASHALQDNLFVPAAEIVFAALGLIQFFVNMRQPNRDLEANRGLALAPCSAARFAMTRRAALKAISLNRGVRKDRSCGRRPTPCAWSHWLPFQCRRSSATGKRGPSIWTVIHPLRGLATRLASI